MDTYTLDAVVIEPDANLAAVQTDILASWGSEVKASATHGATLKHAANRDFIDLLAACVPASNDDRSGAYLATARERRGGLLSTVLMFSDRGMADDRQPAHAVELPKPFSSPRLRRATEDAGVKKNRRALETERQRGAP